MERSPFKIVSNYAKTDTGLSQDMSRKFPCMQLMGFGYHLLVSLTLKVVKARKTQLFQKTRLNVLTLLIRTWGCCIWPLLGEKGDITQG